MDNSFLALEVLNLRQLSKLSEISGLMLQVLNLSFTFETDLTEGTKPAYTPTSDVTLEFVFLLGVS